MAYANSGIVVIEDSASESLSISPSWSIFVGVKPTVSPKPVQVAATPPLFWVPLSVVVDWIQTKIRNQY